MSADYFFGKVSELVPSFSRVLIAPDRVIIVRADPSSWPSGLVDGVDPAILAQIGQTEVECFFAPAFVCYALIDPFFDGDLFGPSQGLREIPMENVIWHLS